MTDFAKLNNLVFELNSAVDLLCHEYYDSEEINFKEVSRLINKLAVKIYELNETPIVINSFKQSDIVPLNERGLETREQLKGEGFLPSSFQNL